MLGLGEFGLLPQDCLGEFFEAPEQYLRIPGQGEQRSGLKPNRIPG